MTKVKTTQDIFLSALHKNKVPVTVFLSNGVKLQGVITGFDQFSIMLRRATQLQLVYKHSMATVVPGVAIDLPFEKADADVSSTHDKEQANG